MLINHMLLIVLNLSYVTVSVLWRIWQRGTLRLRIDFMYHQYVTQSVTCQAQNLSIFITSIFVVVVFGVAVASGLAHVIVVVVFVAGVIAFVIVLVCVLVVVYVAFDVVHGIVLRVLFFSFLF